jgi:transposase
LTNDATRLLGLDGVAVTSVVTGKDGNPMLALVTVDEQARCCPDCGIRSERPHSWVTTKPRDLPVAGRQAELIWNKRRWRCQEAVCPRKTFTEALPQIPSRAGLTCRLRESAGAGVSDLGRTVIQSARDHHVSWPIAQAAFAAHAKNALPATTPLTEVRRRVTVQQRGRRGRKGNRERELRNRLTRSAAKIHAGHLDPMADDLAALPAKTGVPILAAWNAKEDLMDLIALMHHPARTTIAHRLFRFYESCAASGLPEPERLAGTVNTWWPEIEAAIISGVSNAASEGTSRSIKTGARAACGYRNPASQRLRACCATTRRSRGHLTTRTSGKHGQPR